MPTTFWSDRPVRNDLDEAQGLVASLVILADQMSAADVHELIGLKPDRAWNQGDRVGKTGRGRRPFTGWRIDAGGSDPREGSAIVDLLDRVSEVAERIRKASADYRIRSVAMWVWPDSHDPGIDLGPDQLAQIVRLGASLQIDLSRMEGGEER